MIAAALDFNPPDNEPVLSYAPKAPEREAVGLAYKALMQQQRELPCVIAGEEVRTRDTYDVCPPHRHRQKVATCFQGGAPELQQAVDAALAARFPWASWRFDERAAVFLRAAEMLAGRRRALINAATMLGQSKTVHQAEIDSACELIDFLRFNVAYAHQILRMQPKSAPGVRNSTDYRPLDGFVLAVTPFNFTAIAGNLPSSAALMGNTVVWKPARSAALSAQVIMDVLREAGLPPGVINLVHAPGNLIASTVLAHPDLAGVHFTGSTAVFQGMWKTVGENIARYHCYPRLVGETGGKDFIFAHASADVDTLAAAIVRGAFEYQGQKCSAASRLYVPDSMWPALSQRLEGQIKSIKVGDVANFANFMGAVIDAAAFAKIQRFIAEAKTAAGTEVWLGGGCDDTEGYFIAPTVVLVDDPKAPLMCEEVFGPVLAVYRYPERAFAETLALCDQTSPYALTGAIFATDRVALGQAADALRFAAGNLYYNDKPTGAVVGQQPFGGSRASGTNDKAGSMLNLLRWTSARTIKETLDGPRHYAYPFMQTEG